MRDGKSVRGCFVLSPTVAAGLLLLLLLLLLGRAVT
jgi:hypothetical protein